MSLDSNVQDVYKVSNSNTEFGAKQKCSNRANFIVWSVRKNQILSRWTRKGKDRCTMKVFTSNDNGNRGIIETDHIDEYDWTPRKDRSALVLTTGLAIVGLIVYVLIHLT